MSVTLERPWRTCTARRCRPWSGLKAAAARVLLRAVARRVPVDLRLPDGSSLEPKHRDRDLPALEIVRPDALYSRLAEDPKTGIGEGYMAGDWRAAEGTDLAEALQPFAERMTSALPPALLRFRTIVDRPLQQLNSLSESRRNVEAHYDLSNDFFATFLDQTLTYSAAFFDERRPFAGQDLAEAQVRKVGAILDCAQVCAGSRVLEIGTGWGSLAIQAARRGAHVTTVTLSQQQAALARERVTAAGVDDLVEVRLQDYREVRGRYDAVVSVEMIEAVGEDYWPTYFTALDRLLRPGGVAAIQSILMAHERFLETRDSAGWIQKHIFPGGMIPSPEAIASSTREHTSLRVERVASFGPHYAETLRRWRGAFGAASDEVDRLGFDAIFRRKWEFYLAYCEAGFAAGYLDVAQLRLTRSARGDQA